MSDKHFIGLDVTSFENTGKHDPVSRVTLFLDDENYYTAGDDTGKEITASCPSATQAMADALLAKLKGYQHQSFNAGAANIDPAAELGDGVTVGGIYAGLVQIKDDGCGYSDIAAPDEPELEDEYPYISPIQQEINRKSTEIYSLITKTSEEIRLEVQGLENQFTAVSVTLDGLTVTDSTGTTRIKGTSIETDTLIVNAANISGTLAANQVNLSGAITWSDLSKAVQNDINDAYSMAEDAQTAANEVDDVVSGWTYSGTTYIDGTKLMTGTVMASSIQGGEVILLDARERTAGSLTLTGSTSYSGQKIVMDSGAIELNASSGNIFASGGSGAYVQISDDVIVGMADLVPNNNATWSLGNSSKKWNDVYAANGTIVTSDLTKKNSVIYGLDAYDALFDGLKPISYKLNSGESGRRHMGLGAQDVERLLAGCGISDMDFAAFIKSPRRDETGQVIEGEYDYALRYGELIALLIAQVQRLKNRVNALEGTV